MADSVLRLYVKSDEYDSKLKRAAEGIKRYADECKKVGGTLEILDEGVLDFVQALGKMDTVATNSKQQLREISNALTTLTATYRELSEEDKKTDFGKGIAQGIQQLTERAGLLQDAMTDVQQSIRNAASDTRMFDQMAQGMSVVTAGFQGLTGAGKLLGIEMGNDVEVIAKLQAAMAVTNSLTTIQTALQKQSALMQGVMAVQAKAAAAAIELEGSATKGATVAQTAFNAVAKANPYVLLATTIAAVGSAMYVLSQRNKEATAAEKEQIAAVKKQQAEFQKMQSTIGSAVGSIEAKYRSLQKEWSMLNTLGEKNDFIKEHANAFKQLGLSVNSVTAAEQVLVSMAPQVVTALRSVAEAEAYSDLYKQAVQNKVKNWTFRSKSRATGDFYTKVGDSEKTQRGVLAPDEWTAAGLFKGQDYTQRLKGIASYEFKLTQSGIDKINKYREQEAKKLNKKLEQDYEDDIKKYEDLWAAAEQRAAKNKSQIPLSYLSGSTPSGGGSGSGKTTTATVEKELSIQQQIAALEKEAYTASEERRAEIAKTIQELDKELARQKEIRDTLHGIQKEIANPQIIQGISIQNAAGMNEYLSMLTQHRSMANFGSAVYNNLTSQITDVTTLRNLVGESLKAGLGTSLFDVADETGRDFWTRAMEGGVENIDWQTIVDKINEARKAAGLDAIKIDFVTGSVSGEKVSNTSSAANGKNDFNKLVGNVSTISGALQQLGVEIPEGFSKTLGILQVISTITMAIQSLVGISASTSILKSIPVIGWFLHNGGVVHAANGFAGTVPGTQFSGDNIPAMLDAGETVLSRSQTNLLASVLNDTNRGGIGRSEAVIESDQIRLVLQNGAQAAGKTIGEYLGIG